MSDQQHMDDFFKKALEEYTPVVPPDAWDRIAGERKKRRLAMAWWRQWRTGKLLIAAILLSLLVSGTFFLKKNEAVKKTVTAESNSIENNLHPEQFTATGDAGSKAAGDKDSEKPIAKNNNAAGKSLLPGSAVSETVSPLKTAAGKATLSKEKHRTSEKSLTKVVAYGIAFTAASSPGKHIKQGKRSVGSKMQLQVYLPETGEIGNDTGLQNGIEPAEENAVENVLIREQGLTKLPFNINTITAASLATKSDKQVVLNGIVGPDCPELEKNAAGNKTYWEAYTSIDYAIKKYADTANSVFAEKRKATTSFHSAFSAGVRFTKVFGNGVSIRAGINFSQINEKFSFIQSNTVQTTYIIDAATGDTTGSFVVRGTKYKTSLNNYRTLDIPLVIGYEAGNGRLHANFNAGAVVNLYSWQNGELLDTAYQPVSITTGKGLSEFQYKNNIGIGFTAGASFYYKLNDRLHLMAEPYFRYNFSPMNKEALSLQERFTTMGLRLGVRFDF